MEAWISALVGYWFPFALVPLGIWLSLVRGNEKLQKIGLPLAVLGIIFVMASPWTAPESDSSASGHLLLSIAGPVLLLAWGCFLAIFGGQVPVGRLPPVARKGGYAAILLGISWLAFMHYEAPPIWRGDINPFWGAWWAVFILSAIMSSGLLAQVTHTIGDMRTKETILMVSICFSFVLLGLIFFMLVDTNATSAEQFRTDIWLAGADLFGTVIGGLLAIAIFAIVITIYERNLPEPAKTNPLSIMEKERVTEILKDVVGGEKDE
ncbi:MAG TPA: hypothetical protein EYQ53_04245 [Candidatus Poseidoniales archaeon]|jgi:hypothetical protein|nr:MAG: hypothetical protein CXT69_04545 [Euryarchaeota archaeon]HIG03573.1 hypothetical protein [Candidatus Poseidoniales archaeon]